MSSQVDAEIKMLTIIVICILTLFSIIFFSSKITLLIVMLIFVGTKLINFCHVHSKLASAAFYKQRGKFDRRAKPSNFLHANSHFIQFINSLKVKDFFRRFHRARSVIHFFYENTTDSETRWIWWLWVSFLGGGRYFVLRACIWI